MGERILVYGATQGTGALLVARLLANGHAVRALVRDKARAQQLGPEVELVQGDLTRQETLRGAAAGVEQIVCTAGVTQRPAREALIKATEHDGLRAAISAAQADGFRGRFLYMTSLGVNHASLLGWILNRVKGNTLTWRRAAEAAIRASGLPYTIVRAGILVDAPAAQRPLVLSQGDQALTLRTRVGRADVADLLARLVAHVHPQHTTIEAIWGQGAGATDWDQALRALRPDVLPAGAAATAYSSSDTV